MNLYKRCSCNKACKHALWYRFRSDGREVRRSTRTANKHLAGQVAAKCKVSLLTDEHQIRREASPKLSRHIPAYTDWTQARNRTGGKDPQVLARFLAVVGDKRLDKVGTFDVEKWKTKRAKQVKKATVNRELNIVRGCFSRAVEWSLLDKSPVNGVKPFRVDNTRLRILSSEEIERFLIGAPADLGLMARFTVEGLLRISEVLGLTRSDIKSDHLVLPHTKNGKIRKVPITSALRRDLLKRAHPSGHVFGEDRYDGRPPQRPAVTHAFRRTMARLGVEKASHHTLRHTGASVMLAGGVSIRAVQEIGGWSSLRMLERYTHPTDAEKRRAVEITSRLTRVGTKTGTPTVGAWIGDRAKSIKILMPNDLDGVPKGDFTLYHAWGRWYRGSRRADA